MVKAEKQFYIFGMGHRKKHLYKDGTLTEIESGRVVLKWDVESESLLIDRYKVVLFTKDNKKILIEENEEGLYVSDITDGERRDTVCLAESKISLPDFEEYKYPEQMRVLHAELLTSFIGTTPVPNIYVYNTAWYRDSAMMALALEKTGNIELLRPWALSVTELYDKNNKGNCEPDNLGQLLFVLSYFVSPEYPLVKELVNEAKRITEDGLLRGITDYNRHEIYSTLWMKLALEKMGMDTSFIKIPKEFDSYARMFWMDKSEVEEKTPFDNVYDYRYPYLWWAVKHFNGEDVEKELLELKYPMSWEICASEADYEKIAPLSEEYRKNKCGAPHSWHASEMLLYLFEKKS